MTTAVMFSLILGAIVLVFYIREKSRCYSVKGVCLKVFVSLCFIATAVFAGFRNPSSLFLRFVIALSFGLLGDFFLDMKYVRPRSDTPYTYAGFIVFAIGHVFYIVAIISQYGNGVPAGYWIIGTLLGLAAGFGTGFGGKLTNIEYGSFRPIVTFYGYILGSLFFLCGSLCVFHRFAFPALNLMCLAAGLFIISDLVLSQTFFKEGHERKIDFILNYLTYYGAQFLFALSLLWV